MMRQSFERVCKGPLGKALQSKTDGHGSAVFKEAQTFGTTRGATSLNQRVRQGSSTSGWDVGNPPTEEKHPGDVKDEHNDKKDPSTGRPEEASTPNLQKETSTREYFHEKAREVEERLSQEKSKGKEADASKK